MRVTDAHPAGTYTVTVTGFDSSGIGTTKTFTLTVTTPPATCNPVDFKAGTDFGVGPTPHAIAVGDFNRDGKQDVAVADADTDTVSILLGNGTGGFSPATNVSFGNGVFALAVGDFNGDGNEDLATANISAGTVTIRFGDGTGGFAPGITTIAVSSPNSIAVGDFNGDGRQDLVVGHLGAATVSVMLGDGAGGFGPLTNFQVSSAPSSVVVGDFNGDGHQDIATANPSTDDVSILLGTGTGSFGLATNFTVGPVGDNPVALVVGLFNADSIQDLAVVNQGSSNVSILLGNGTGGFAIPAAAFSVSAGPSGAALGDFDGDGKQDLVVSISSGGVSILLGDGTGGFTSAPDFGSQVNRQAVAVGDFDGDGKQDFVTANMDPSNTMSVFLRQCPVAFSIDNVTHNEGNAGTTTPFTFTVTKIGTTTLFTSVTYTTQDGTATLADNDYQFNTATLKFTPTDTALTLTVIVNGDNTVEPNETFDCPSQSPCQRHNHYCRRLRQHHQ